MIPGLDYALEGQGQIWGREDVEICRQCIADRSAGGARQGYGALPRNGRATSHVTAAQRLSTNQCYRVRPLNAPCDCRATPHVTRECSAVELGRESSAVELERDCRIVTFLCDYN